MELVNDADTVKRTIRAERWLILEASLVPAPADGIAQIRSSTAIEVVTDWRITTRNQDTDMTPAEVADIVRAAMAADKVERKAAEKAAAEAAEVTRKAALEAAGQPPKGVERGGEDTAHFATLRSQWQSFGVEAVFDALATRASVDYLTDVVMNGMRKRSNPAQIQVLTTGGLEKANGEDKLMRFGDAEIIKAERARNA